MTTQKPGSTNEEALVRAAVANLARRFASIDVSRIEDVVRGFVDELFAGSQVKTFVGVLAERRARVVLQAIPVEPQESRYYERS
jgi:hypothetical protein